MSPDLPIFLLAIFTAIDNISTVDLHEQVAIIARYHAADVEEIDYISRGYKPWQIEDMLKKMKHRTVTSLGVEFKCNLKSIDCFNYELYATLYNQYDKHGTLPFPGPLTDQPNYIIEVFNLLGALINESRVNIQKTQEKQNKKRK